MLLFFSGAARPGKPPTRQSNRVVLKMQSAGIPFAWPLAIGSERLPTSDTREPAWQPLQRFSRASLGRAQAARWALFSRFR